MNNQTILYEELVKPGKEIILFPKEDKRSKETILFIKEDKFTKEAHELITDLLPKKFGRSGKIWIWSLMSICLLGVYAYIQQLRYGLIVTDMRDFSSWGIYISNFVFFVAISLVGSLVSAILKLANVKWRTPLTRISEVIAVSAIIFAGIIIIVDMGRPERFGIFLFMEEFNLQLYGM